jgi:AcrR family transcriptional regulator
MARPRVRQRILEAALALLKTGGAAALTTRAVAQRAEVTEVSIFNNFGSKAGLLWALIEEVLPQYTALRERLAAPATPDVEAWLVEVFLAARAFFAAILPLAGPALAAPTLTAEGESGFFFGHQALVKRLRQFRRASLVAPGADIPAIALLLLGAAMHAAVTELTLGRTALGGGDRRLAKRLVASLRW